MNTAVFVSALNGVAVSVATICEAMGVIVLKLSICALTIAEQPDVKINKVPNIATNNGLDFMSIMLLSHFILTSALQPYLLQSDQSHLEGYGSSN